MLRVFDILVVLGLVFSAVGLVTSRYDVRWSTVSLDRARQEEHRLDVEWRRLQAELTGAAQPARIDRTARQGMGMAPVPPERHWYVQPDGRIVAPAPRTER